MAGQAGRDGGIMKLKFIAGLAGIVFGLGATSVLACGESLFRVGKGVEYRQYTTPLPGSVLAVANGEAELLMMEQLAAAGHDVHVVSDPSEIQGELEEHDFDVVLAWYSQRDEVTVQLAGSGATYIPVAAENTDEERAARLEYQYSLSGDDNVKTFLKTIHKSLKSSS
jgi:hypothetical protein